MVCVKQTTRKTTPTAVLKAAMNAPDLGLFLCWDNSRKSPPHHRLLQKKTQSCRCEKSQGRRSGSSNAGVQESCPLSEYSVYFGLPPAFLIASIISRV